MFRDREDAARRLAGKLEGCALQDPLVLAIPRGGVVVGAVLAGELGADLDVVLSRKLRAPDQPELAVGAISEDGRAYLNPHALQFLELQPDYLKGECRRQAAEIERRKARFRDVRTQVPVANRSVIVADDGIATGATMIAALRTLKSRNPCEVIVAVPVVAREQIAEIQRWCDEVVYLLAPSDFAAVGQFYYDFRQVEDDEVLHLLLEAPSIAGASATASTS